MTKRPVTQELESMMERFADQYPNAVEYLAHVCTVVNPNEFFTARERFMATLKGQFLHWEQIDRELDQNRRIGAIKLYRQLTGASLKSAVLAVDERQEYLTKLVHNQ